VLQSPTQRFLTVRWSDSFRRRAVGFRPPWFRGTPHAPHRPRALRCRPYPSRRGFVEAKAFFASPSLAPACLAVHLCHAAAPRAPTPATADRATPRRPPRTVGHRSKPTTGDPAPSCSSPAAASPVSAIFIHSLARPTWPPAPLEFEEPRRPLPRQPRPLLRTAADDSPPPERRCRGEPLTVSFPSLHRPKSDPLSHRCSPHPTPPFPLTSGRRIDRPPPPHVVELSAPLFCSGPKGPSGPGHFHRVGQAPQRV
jgi:hypothetical protein